MALDLTSRAHWSLLNSHTFKRLFRKLTDFANRIEDEYRVEFLPSASSHFCAQYKQSVNQEKSSPLLRVFFGGEGISTFSVDFRLVNCLFIVFWHLRCKKTSFGFLFETSAKSWWLLWLRYSSTVLYPTSVSGFKSPPGSGSPQKTHAITTNNLSAMSWSFVNLVSNALAYMKFHDVKCRSLHSIKSLRTIHCFLGRKKAKQPWFHACQI